MIDYLPYIVTILGSLLTFLVNLLIVQNSRKAVKREAARDMNEAWEAFCESQQARIDQLTRQVEYHERIRKEDREFLEGRIRILEDSLRVTQEELLAAKMERDAEKARRIAFEERLREIESEVTDVCSGKVDYNG